jgi:predicted metal-binding transcription factor (methanogenesis marker protein 9)
MIIINIAMANDANKAKIESKQISESDNMTSDELLELKKELAEEIVDKLLQKDSSLF